MRLKTGGNLASDKRFKKNLAPEWGICPTLLKIFDLHSCNEKKKLLSVSISISADSSHIGHIKHDYQNHKCEIQIHTILDRSLMIDWRENSWNFECVSSVFTFVCVCLSVCNRATEQTFWHRNLIFGLSDPCDMKKKRFFVFKNLHFYTFYWHFSIFPL